MKKLFRIIGILCIVCAILMFVLAAVGEETSNGVKVGTGVMIDGQYQRISSGNMGYNADAMEDMGILKGCAALVGVLGVGMVIVAALKKDDDRKSRY